MNTHERSSFSKEHKNNIRAALKRFSNTRIEQKIVVELKRRGVKFEQNVGVSSIKNVDFYLPKQNVVIECNSCFYHACLEHGHPAYHQYARTDDAADTRVLEKHGYNVFRFWEHEINASVEKRVNQIENETRN